MGLDQTTESFDVVVVEARPAGVEDNEKAMILGSLVDHIVAAIAQWRLSAGSRYADADDGFLVADSVDQLDGLLGGGIWGRNHRIDTVGRIDDLVEHVVGEGVGQHRRPAVVREDFGE